MVVRAVVVLINVDLQVVPMEELPEAQHLASQITLPVRVLEVAMELQLRDPVEQEGQAVLVQMELQDKVEQEEPVWLLL